MKRISHLVCAGLALLGGGLACAAPVLYTVAPNASGIPSMKAIDANSLVQAQSFQLGDGSLAFNGGVAYDSTFNSFFLMANDSNMVSRLMTASTTGTLNELYIAGEGFTGGLALAAGDLFGIASDANGLSSFYQLAESAGGSASLQYELGLGFNGGLTYSPFDQSFYAIQNDSNAVSRLFRFDLSGAGSITDIGTIGFGVFGGLTVGMEQDRFYFIASDQNGESILFDVNLNGGAINGLMILGNGYNNAGLTIGPSELPAPPPDPGGGGEVPEPSTFALLGGALLSLCMLRRNRIR